MCVSRIFLLPVNGEGTNERTKKSSLFSQNEGGKVDQQGCHTVLKMPLDHRVTNKLNTLRDLMDERQVRKRFFEWFCLLTPPERASQQVGSIFPYIPKCKRNAQRNVFGVRTEGEGTSLLPRFAHLSSLVSRLSSLVSRLSSCISLLALSDKSTFPDMRGRNAQRNVFCAQRNDYGVYLRRSTTNSEGRSAPFWRSESATAFFSFFLPFSVFSGVLKT